jgi:hypothetical protein
MSKRKKVRLYDASDPEQVKAREAEAEDQDRDILFIASQPRGRRWLYNLMFDRGHKDRISHVPIETESTAFNEGARSVALSVEEELRTASSALYMKTLEENHFNG